MRSNSATANGETEYNKIHIVFVEVEHAKYSTTLYTQNAEYGNTEIQQYVTALGSGQILGPIAQEQTVQQKPGYYTS